MTTGENDVGRDRKGQIMNMTSEYRPISNTACDTATCEKPTIGALTLETLDMQAETSAMLCKIVGMMLGDECTATPVMPSENLMSRLAAIQVNQRDIMRAVKAIVDML